MRAAIGTSKSNNYHRLKKKYDRRTFLLFVGPAVVAFSLMMLWPLANLFYLSLVRWPGLLKPKEFVGFANFVRLFADRHFHRALMNTGIHILISMPGVMVPAFILGFFLNQRLRGYRTFRTVFFVPAMISVTGLAMMFVGVYLPQGILNALLRVAGLEEWTRAWLGNPSTVLLSIIAMDLYAGTGYYAVLFLAALSGISNELAESARLDGARQWTVMWRIFFPLSLDFFGIASMLHLLWILLGAGQRVLLLTRGGPGNYSLTLGYYLYEQAFTSQQLGYSQAIGVVIFSVGVIGMFLIRKLTRRDYQL